MTDRDLDLGTARHNSKAMNAFTRRANASVYAATAPVVRGYSKGRCVRAALTRATAGRISVLLAAIVLGGCRPQPQAPEPQPVATPDLPAISAKAERGDAPSQFALGQLHAQGQGVKEDYVMAATWYRRAAEQGHAAAQTALGELHEAGQGVTRDEAAAAQWYRRAADQGYAPGQYNLAVLYAVGRGVPLDHREALKWYERAAEQGDALAQYNLGMRYLEGNGVSPDRVAAWKWLTLAAASASGGSDDARKAKHALASRITSAERSQAESQVREFHKRTSQAASREAKP